VDARTIALGLQLTVADRRQIPAILEKLKTSWPAIGEPVFPAGGDA
jgi:hypothetical protein